MHQLQRSWVRSQHPSAQWNLRGGRWSSVEYSTKEKSNSPSRLLYSYSLAAHDPAPHLFRIHSIIQPSISTLILCPPLPRSAISDTVYHSTTSDNSPLRLISSYPVAILQPVLILLTNLRAHISHLGTFVESKHMSSSFLINRFFSPDLADRTYVISWQCHPLFPHNEQKIRLCPHCTYDKNWNNDIDIDNDKAIVMKPSPPPIHVRPVTIP